MHRDAIIFEMVAARRVTGIGGAAAGLRHLGIRHYAGIVRMYFVLDTIYAARVKER
jgi:hypothetical protein